MGQNDGKGGQTEGKGGQTGGRWDRMMGRGDRLGGRGDRDEGGTEWGEGDTLRGRGGGRDWKERLRGRGDRLGGKTERKGGGGTDCGKMGTGCDIFTGRRKLKEWGHFCLPLNVNHNRWKAFPHQALPERGQAPTPTPLYADPRARFQGSGNEGLRCLNLVVEWPSRGP